MGKQASGGQGQGFWDCQVLWLWHPAHFLMGASWQRIRELLLPVKAEAKEEFMGMCDVGFINYILCAITMTEIQELKFLSSVQTAQSLLNHLAEALVTKVHHCVHFTFKRNKTTPYTPIKTYIGPTDICRDQLNKQLPLQILPGRKPGINYLKKIQWIIEII